MFDNNWKYTSWHGDGGEVGFTISDSVLGTYMAQINAQEYNVPVEVGEARARLIAAAPKTKRDRDALLAACEAATLWLNDDGPDIDAGQLEDVLKAAIAAAKDQT